MVKRPIRLGGVLIFSLLCAALLFEFGGFFHQSMATLHPSTWLTQFWTIDFSWSELVKRIVTFRAGSEYNPPLWTLRIELIGSFLVFGLLLLINRLPYALRLLVLCVCLCLVYSLLSPFYAGFIWGMLLADAHKQGYIKPIPLLFQRIGIALCAVLAAYPYYANTAGKQWAETTPALLVLITEHISMLAAVAMLLLVISSPWLQRVLQRRFLVWLGEVSYALYAMHLLIIGSVLAYLQVNMSSSLGYGYASLVNVALYICLLLIVSWLVTQFIDAPAVKLANKIDLPARQLAAQVQQRFNKTVLRNKLLGL